MLVYTSQNKKKVSKIGARHQLSGCQHSPMDTDDVHPFSCTHFPLALLLSICRESLVAVFPDKGRHVKLARASIVVHVSNLAEHWPFPPALVVDTTDGPHATCQVTIKANERKFTVNKITTTMLFVREYPCPVYVTR